MGMWKTVKVEKGIGFAVFFERLYERSWGYMGMSDRASWEPEDKFELQIATPDEYGKVTNCGDDNIRVLDLTKDDANKIWYNLKHREFTLNEFLSCLEKDGKVLRDAFGKELKEAV